MNDDVDDDVNERGLMVNDASRTVLGPIKGTPATKSQVVVRVSRRVEFQIRFSDRINRFSCPDVKVGGASRNIYMRESKRLAFSLQSTLPNTSPILTRGLSRKILPELSVVRRFVEID